MWPSRAAVSKWGPDAGPTEVVIPMQNLGKQPPAGPAADGSASRYRIGAVSRLADIPVATLRVWERRYGAFQPAKSEGQHRLYSEADLIKARLLRQLTGAGHGIGTIAHLPAQRLQDMLGQARAASGSPAPAISRVSLAVVGAPVAARLNSAAWSATYHGQALELQRVFADLDAVEAQAASVPAEGGDPDLLVVRLDTLHASAGEQLARVVAQLRVKQAIVLYVYGAPDLVDALRAAGMIVRREPVSDAELAELIRSELVVDAAATIASQRAGALIPPRRFSDAMLAQVAASPAHMLCECPRHIAELVQQLASFEEYSRDCLNRSTEDAQVHAYLRSVAGSARALFERALVVVARHDGLDLPDT
jgi:MerR family transcriptional regulator, light-induced transcriptional regulator